MHRGHEDGGAVAAQLLGGVAGIVGGLAQIQLAGGFAVRDADAGGEMQAVALRGERAG